MFYSNMNLFYETLNQFNVMKKEHKHKKHSYNTNKLRDKKKKITENIFTVIICKPQK